MNFDRLQGLAAVIAAHPNCEVVGRTRLQKTVRLLQRLGFPTDYRFSIHFFGPYSEELQTAIGLLENWGWVEEQEHARKDGNVYYTIRAIGPRAGLEAERFVPAIQRLAETDPVVLELAATYDAFRELGCDHDEAMRRLRRKKGDKCDGGRDVQALALLQAIGLPAA